MYVQVAPMPAHAVPVGQYSMLEMTIHGVVMWTEERQGEDVG